MTEIRQLLSYSCLMPPTIFIITCLVGVVIGLRRPRIGAVIAITSACALYLFSMPAVPRFIEQQLLSFPAANVDFSSAQAIVVPSVDVRWGDGINIPDAVGALTLERLANAARLYRRLRVPVLVTGAGPLDRPGPSLASLMRDELEHDFAVPVTFTETQAHNTFEHGLYASRILEPKGLYDVVIVAQDRDLRRLLWSFERAGLRPIPAPITTRFGQLEIEDFLPSASAFLQSYYAVHEIIGTIYYKIAY